MSDKRQLSAAAPFSLERVLDVGCGEYKISGAIGIDRRNWPNVDVVHDLNCYPWPFPDDSFDRIVCRHSLPHLDDVVRAMDELHRIARPGATVEVVTPHFTSDNCFTDPTTRAFFGHRSMDYFCVDRPLKYRYSDRQFRLREVRISFVQARCYTDEERKFNPMKLLGIEWLINRFPRAYEHFFAFVLRANEMFFRLEVLKSSPK